MTSVLLLRERLSLEGFQTARDIMKLNEFVRVITGSHEDTVVRTPNGNDYGRDLLRQHHAQFDHARADHHHR